MRRALTLVCVVSIWLGVSPVAEGHLLWHRDAQGDAASDDLVGVRLSTHRRDDGTKMLRLKAGFRTGTEPYDSCCYDISFWFDSRGNGDPDYRFTQAYDAASGGVYSSGLYTADGRQVDARFVRSCGGDYCEDFPVRFKIGLLHPRKHIRWYVDTGEDRAPDVGWFEH